MAKKITTRIINKHDVQANWDKDVVTFVPEQGEIIVYDADASFSYERIKIGDGVHVPKDLPFILDEKIATKTGVTVKTWTTADV